MRLARSPWTCVALVIASLGFGFWHMNLGPVAELETMAKTRDGAILLDMQPYTASEATAIAAAWGKDGRALYRSFLLGDWVFLVLNAGMFSTLLWWIGRGLGDKHASWARYLVVLPIVAAVLDAIENTATHVLLAQATPSTSVAWIGVIASSGKFVLVPLISALIVGLSIALLIGHLRRTRSREHVLSADIDRPPRPV